MENINKPLVSICSLTFNHEAFIRDCLDGFVMQKTNFTYEILIHDDASTDKTQTIIKEYQSKYPDLIKPILQKENQFSKGVKGINGKYNFSRSQGKYLALCEGDDYWTDPYKLQKQVDYMEANPEVVLTHHLYKNIDLDGKIISESKNPLPCTLVYRNVMSDMPERGDCPNGDRFLLTFLSLKGKFKYLENIGHSVRRYHPGGVMSMQSVDVKLDRQARTWSAVYEAFKDTKLKDELFNTRNMYVYMKKLRDWDSGKATMKDLLLFPYSVNQMSLYKLLIRKLLKKEQLQKSYSQSANS
jgi:glycosyltransferase involved in cell wall biosynthesis